MHPLDSRILVGKYIIRFSDCDPLGHLYNGTYIRYFQNAREDQIQRNYNLNLARIATEEKAAWVVVQNKISYIKPALPNQWVHISSSVYAFSERFADVEMIMWNEDRTEIKSLLWAKFAFVDLENHKTKKQHDRYAALFKNALLELPQKDFDSRNTHMRKFNRKMIDNIY